MKCVDQTNCVLEITLHLLQIHGIFQGFVLIHLLDTIKKSIVIEMKVAKMDNTVTKKKILRDIPDFKLIFHPDNLLV